MVIPSIDQLKCRRSLGVASVAAPHLDALESESIHILREVAAAFENPVLLYSIGKDSSVILHLMRKAFYPGKVRYNSRNHLAPHFSTAKHRNFQPRFTHSKVGE